MIQIPETYFTVQEQTTLFLYACLLGLPIGLFFDIFRILRVLFPHHLVVTILEDILFCFGYAVVLAAFTVTACRGEFRLFYAVGMLLGSLLWRLLFGNPFLKIIRRTAIVIHNCLSHLLHPVTALFARLKCKIKQNFRQSIQNIEKKKKNHRFHLIAARHLLYNKRKQDQEVKQNVRCSKTKASATAKKKTNPKRRRAVQPAGNRNRKQKRKVSL
ncbi:MAG: spore cortex biosynthesis protein YabQ [Oscillospiraceae bacterium]|nr:spore cortex biosynthesis protein YabQ [Oscillospiraceae bacterium]